MVKWSPFQGGDAGSIPATYTNISIICRYLTNWLGDHSLKVKILVRIQLPTQIKIKNGDSIGIDTLQKNNDGQRFESVYLH